MLYALPERPRLGTSHPAAEPTQSRTGQGHVFFSCR